MGLLDDAIKEHLDLKRRRGADPGEIERAEREALGPVRRKGEAVSDEEPVAAQDVAGSAYDEPDEGVAADLAELSPSELHADELTPSDGYAREDAPADTYADAADGPPPMPAHEDEPDWSYEDERTRVVGPEPPATDREPPITDREPPVTNPEPPATDPDPPAAARPAAEPPVPARAPVDFTDEHDEPFADEPPPTAQAPAPPSDVTAEFDVEEALAAEEARAAERERAADEEDVLEETPEFLQDTPDHDRLWFEQRPPRDFDFDG